MSDYIVQTEHLTKKLENVTIVDDLIDLLALQSGVDSSRKKSGSEPNHDIEHEFKRI